MWTSDTCLRMHQAVPTRTACAVEARGSVAIAQLGPDWSCIPLPALQTAQYQVRSTARQEPQAQAAAIQQAPVNQQGDREAKALQGLAEVRGGSTGIRSRAFMQGAGRLLGRQSKAWVPWSVLLYCH